MLVGGAIGVGLLGGGTALGWGIRSAQEAPHAEAGSTTASSKKTPPVRRFRSTDLTAPAVRTWSRADTAAGLLFVTQQTKDTGGNGFQGLIMDDHGEPVWIEPSGANITDLRVQTFEGAPVLTYWEGTSEAGHGAGTGRILDSTYTRVAEVKAGNGLDADLHEFHLTSRGTALLTAYTVIDADLSTIGGPSAGHLYDCHVQEVDVRSGRVLLDWSAHDHVPVAETYLGLDQDEGHDGTTASRAFDAYHLNAIDDDGDQLLVSLRHTHTVYAIDRTSGAIRWRLGGRRSDYTVPYDASFAWQHDVRRHADGTITLFDNHLYAEGDGQSRGLRFRLGSTAAARTGQQTFNRHLGTAMGSVQDLDGGHVLVGWGTAPFVTEFDDTGTAVFEADLGGMSYRAYRHAWQGRPAAVPAIAAAGADGHVDVRVTWNGATDVAHWRVRAGSGSGSASGSTLTEAAVIPRTGFETHIRIAPATVVAADALSASGKVLATTPTITVAAAAA